MKAKEYSARYKADTDVAHALSQMALDFLMEIRSLVEMRSAHSDRAMMAILDEQDAKWRAVANLCELNPDGFRLLMRAHMPSVFERWAKPHWNLPQ